MKGIDSYISEKLKINKESGSEEVLPNKLGDNIIYITSLKNNKNTHKVFYRWVKENHIRNINTYLLFTVDSHKYLNSLNRIERNKIYHEPIEMFQNEVLSYFPEEQSDWEKLTLYGEEGVSIYGVDDALYVETDDYSMLITKKD